VVFRWLTTKGLLHFAGTDCVRRGLVGAEHGPAMPSQDSSHRLRGTIPPGWISHWEIIVALPGRRRVTAAMEKGE